MPTPHIWYPAYSRNTKGRGSYVLPVSIVRRLQISATITNGFRATGLFPFNPKFVQENPEKFQMADTLDADKMNAKIFGHNENSTVSESYKMLVTSTEKLDQEFAGARSVLQ